MASILARFFGRTVSEGAAFAAGLATAPVLAPGLRELENVTWREFPLRPLSPGDAAGIVAEDVELQDWGRSEALNTGVSTDRFDALLGEALNAPGLPQLFEAWRRDLITDAAFEHGLRKAKLETRWDGPLKALKQHLLDPEVLANARQQEFIDDARLHDEGGKQGYTAERLDLLFKLAGLPPGVETGLEMLRRSIIDDARFAHLVATGHTKTEWTQELLRLRDRVLGAATYAGLALRGWITQAEMHAGGALTGYTAAQMDLLYKEHGRPATGRQVFIGLRRGGTYNGPTTGIAPAFIDAIRQSNIRPEWTSLLWAQRFTYPSAFVLRGLTQGGDLTQAQTEQILLYEGWEPGLATTVSTKWAGGTTAAGDKHAAKAQTQLWTTLHRSYLAGESTAAEITAALPRAGVSAAAIPDVLATWDEERTIIRKQLSPAQVKKAFVEQVTNPDTGTPWTKDEATAALVARGYSTADATTFLEL